MLHYAIVFLVVALIAAFLGFSALAGLAAGIAKILFVVFLVLAVGEPPHRALSPELGLQAVRARRARCPGWPAGPILRTGLWRWSTERCFR